MNWLELCLRKRFIAMHGIGEAHQADLYRCQTCGRLITWRNIRDANVCCQGRLVPSEPKWFEVVKLFVTPWLYWRKHDERV